MKIIAPAALVAATLILTAAVPASADGDHRAPRTGQKPPVPAAASKPSLPTMTEEAPDTDLPQGILPRIMDQLL
ncbi:hypothetical protein [Streptomyces viridochromogenes]|uniref:Secreted protein n=1 Tax=Streptomyces viridochromogenes Tue57 TaxID=1160705 RepID=L8PKP0_STRVR|nr:hypothetical protein [Streptomyces viridochromogenes]ELS56824.1 hypothetical protein STVIR_2200 [Streptomyces viridochromogenes Tue57]